MADLVTRGLARWCDDVALAEMIALAMLRAALVICLLWYATLVILRPTPTPIQPAPDVHWGVAERSHDVMEA
jgi:hypothetical protein